MARQQLTGFFASDRTIEIERLRRQLDPVQSSIIAAHVTICREDEITGVSWSDITARATACEPLKLTFDRIERVGEYGLLLCCSRNLSGYELLRATLLATSSSRRSEAHLTLAHPRNQNPCVSSFLLPESLLPLELVVDELSLIEQSSSGDRWSVLRKVRLHGG